MRLLDRRPDAHTWSEKVGYPAVYSAEPRPPNMPGEALQVVDAMLKRRFND